MQNKQTNSSELTTAKPTPIARGLKQIGRGCYIIVKADLTVGKFSHGGPGFVKDIDGEGAESPMVMTVVPRTVKNLRGSVYIFCKEQELQRNR